MRHYEFIEEYRGALDSLAKTYGQRILDKLKIVPERINSGYKGDAEVGDDYETIAVRTLDQLNSEKRTAQNLPITSNHGTTEYENLTPEIYNEHKGAIVNRIIGTLAEYDPTEKKGYTQYILKWFLSDNYNAFPNIEDGRSTLKESLYYFQKMKARLPENYRDIAQYTSAKNFMASVQHFRDEYGKKEELPKGKSEIIYQTKDVTVRWAENQEAACHLGQGTQWCTASTQAKNFFDQYNKEGPLIIVNFTKPFIIGYDVDGTEEEQKLDPSFALEKQIQKLQMHFTNSSEEDPDEEYYDPGNWEVTQIADEADDVIDFNALYDSGPWNTNMGGDETYESPFKKMWNDSKFHNAIDKVWEHWRDV